MKELSLREVTQENWREALSLTVKPEQHHFVVGMDAPIVLVALAKAYIRPNGLMWNPYVFYEGTTMVGFAALAYEQASVDNYFLRHFFIDHRYQGRGYGKEALNLFIQHLKEKYSRCQILRLTVHPENLPAQKLYEHAGFQFTGEQSDGEPVYMLHLKEEIGK
jgi:diamine N-acetyltransferase